MNEQTVLTVTWENGFLVVEDEDGEERACIPYGEPINAGTDSHAIAGIVCDEIGWNTENECPTVDHDGEYIHISYMRFENQANNERVRDERLL